MKMKKIKLSKNGQGDVSREELSPNDTDDVDDDDEDSIDVGTTQQEIKYELSDHSHSQLHLPPSNIPRINFSFPVLTNPNVSS